ncbi:type II toxin-antitoxin system VapC family toxin [Thermococcus barophilus]|uniref:Uncharacterized protein n=1 Tax=Thermococcus barophilus (strain DSM 11836 / MP) TaxID=391623 RepID=F0LLW1_THEBM|nr:type II toxin-antitoxin system VapC family toxin [Thermococcus barophilus]ADT85060.1 hypothetical protein TERMP_02086 [Thermococcus barophilus MP]
MIVIDASSLAKYILREENWKTEVSNAIWKHHVLYKAISNKEVGIMLEVLKKLKEDVVIFEPFEDYLGDAVKIAIGGKISIYDALYLAQAKKYGSLLISDEKQWKIAKKLGIKAEYVEQRYLVVEGN